MIRIWNHLPANIRREFALAQTRYQYRPYYAITWLCCVIILRLLLFVIPLLIIFWQIIFAPNITHLAVNEDQHEGNYALKPVMTWLDSNQQPVNVTGEKLNLQEGNRYHLEGGRIRINDNQDSIAAKHIFMTGSEFQLEQQVLLQQNRHRFSLRTTQMQYQQNLKHASIEEDFSGRLAAYQFSGTGLTYPMHDEIVFFKQDVKFWDHAIHFSAPEGMKLDLKKGEMHTDALLWQDESGAQASANRAYGVFLQKNGTKFLKRLHFLENFSYHGFNSEIIADSAALHMHKQQVHHLIMGGDIRVIHGKRTLTGDAAYLDYATRDLELCGNVEIISAGGQRVATPCAIIALNNQKILRLGQKKHYLP